MILDISFLAMAKLLSSRKELYKVQITVGTARVSLTQVVD